MNRLRKMQCSYSRTAAGVDRCSCCGHSATIHRLRRGTEVQDSFHASPARVQGNRELEDRAAERSKSGRQLVGDLSGFCSSTL